ncbi:hypothetical protein [Microbacterium sp. SORGH_AS_0888]|uniref:hypothetical protein n=1 Tax=Microbacterium sp. SORGH_AS_0888 TaxID=3041791 RepID=UPI00278A1887|nr:hypothetical protein [Microbacterium sp. SORGH_AS_0888]MDQ1129424.1 hypothetical protein [Microbacterium sp. SORGH_AS_0888]
MLNACARLPVRRKIALLCCGMILPLSVMTGCAADAADPSGRRATDSPTETSPEARKDRASWTLPLDDFTTPGDNTINYAEQLAVQPCLEDAGYDWPVPWQDVGTTPTPTLSPFGARLFDEQIARTWGYHPGEFQTESSRLWDEFLAHTRVTQEQPGFDEKFKSCIAAVRDEYSTPSYEDQLLVSQYAAQSQERARTDPAVTAAAARWRECMEPLGLAALPEDRHDMPTPELSAEFGLTPFGLPDPSAGARSVPSAKEIEIAVADATCAESSGYSETLYETTWNLQAHIVETERATLDRVRQDVVAQKEAAQRIIAERAPAAPSP